MSTMNQLSFFPDPFVVKGARRKYLRDRSGRFANKKKLEVEEAKRSAAYYKLMYEAECRKLEPLLKRLVAIERELYNLKHK